MALTSSMLDCRHVSQPSSGMLYSKYSHSGDGASPPPSPVAPRQIPPVIPSPQILPPSVAVSPLRPASRVQVSPAWPASPAFPGLTDLRQGRASACSPQPGSQPARHGSGACARRARCAARVSPDSTAGRDSSPRSAPRSSSCPSVPAARPPPCPCGGGA